MGFLGRFLVPSCCTDPTPGVSQCSTSTQYIVVCKRPGHSQPWQARWLYAKPLWLPSLALCLQENQSTWWPCDTTRKRYYDSPTAGHSWEWIGTNRPPVIRLTRGLTDIENAPWKTCTCWWKLWKRHRVMIGISRIITTWGDYDIKLSLLDRNPTHPRTSVRHHEWNDDSSICINPHSLLYKTPRRPTHPRTYVPREWSLFRQYKACTDARLPSKA